MSIKLEIIPQKPPQNLEEILENLFWKEPEVAKTARDFLQNIKTWGKTETPYTVDQWRQYTLRHDITQSTYHNMLKRLRKAGMVDKTYNKGLGKHELKVSGNFALPLEQMASIWNKYLDE
jgi:hypothetical protein